VCCGGCTTLPVHRIKPGFVARFGCGWRIDNVHSRLYMSKNARSLALTKSNRSDFHQGCL
jgi:hypothetical protein